MKFSIKDFFSKCDQICSFLRIWSHLMKKSLMENFIFCAVQMYNHFVKLYSDFPFDFRKKTIMRIVVDNSDKKSSHTEKLVISYQ